jgi:hypothetical protein
MLWKKWPRDVAASGAVTPETEVPMHDELYGALT